MEGRCSRPSLSSIPESGGEWRTKSTTKNKVRWNAAARAHANHPRFSSGGELGSTWVASLRANGPVCTSGDLLRCTRTRINSTPSIQKYDRRSAGWRLFDRHAILVQKAVALAGPSLRTGLPQRRRDKTQGQVTHTDRYANRRGNAVMSVAGLRHVGAPSCAKFAFSRRLSSSREEQRPSGICDWCNGVRGKYRGRHEIAAAHENRRRENSPRVVLIVVDDARWYQRDRWTTRRTASTQLFCTVQTGPACIWPGEALPADSCILITGKIMTRILFLRRSPEGVPRFPIGKVEDPQRATLVDGAQRQRAPIGHWGVGRVSLTRRS